MSDLPTRMVAVSAVDHPDRDAWVDEQAAIAATEGGQTEYVLPVVAHAPASAELAELQQRLRLHPLIQTDRSSTAEEI